MPATGESVLDLINTLGLPAPAPRPISPKRLEANRRNAQLATGPRTEEGKQRSRLNALRHGITGQVSILPDSERHAAEAFCQGFVEQYAPANMQERLLVRSIAEDYWRIGRARAMENNWFAIDIAHRRDDDMAGDEPQIANAVHMAKTFRDNPWSFQLLTLYEQRAYRNLDRNLRRLEEARRQHAALRAQALRDSGHLSCIYARHGRAFDPAGEAKANGGFVFSNEEISAALERRRFLNEDPDAPQALAA